MIVISDLIFFSDEELESYDDFVLKGNILVANGKEYIVKAATATGFKVVESK